jgi:AmmeMemoRadiSam system protein A
MELKNQILNLTRDCINGYLETGNDNFIMPEYVGNELNKKGDGVFVTISKKNGELRGCVGTIARTQPTLAMEIIVNAIAAAVKDPRFKPVTFEEFKELTVEIDVLSKLEKITSINDLDIKKYGLLIERNNKSGIVLPGRSDINTIQAQIKKALQKAGLDGGLYGCSLYRFTTTRY